MRLAAALAIFHLLGSTNVHGTAFTELPKRSWEDYHHMVGDSIPTLVRKATQISQDIQALRESKYFYHGQDEGLLIRRGYILAGLADHAKSTPFDMDGAPASALALYVCAGHDLIGRCTFDELSFFYVGLMGVWPMDIYDVGLKDHRGATLTRTDALKTTLRASFLSGVNSHFVSACRLLETQWNWSTPCEIKGPHNTLSKEDVSALIAYFEPRQDPAFTSCLFDVRAGKLMPLKYFGFPW